MKRLSRGRPTGSKAAFLKSPRRFEVALWVAATSNGLPDYQAANLAVALIRSDRPITAAFVSSEWSALSTEYYGSDLETNVDHFTRYAQGVMAKASEREYEWIVESAQYLGALAVSGGDPEAARRCIGALRGLGWEGVLARLGARLEPALKSNFPPFDGVLRKRTRARLNPPVT